MIRLHAHPQLPLFLSLPDVGDWWCLGQAVSHAGHIYYSGGASLAVNNVFKSGDTAPLHKYEYVSFPKVYLILNIWWPMPLFLHIYFIYIYRYNMEVDRRGLIHTIFRLGFACGFVG